MTLVKRERELERSIGAVRLYPEACTRLDLTDDIYYAVVMAAWSMFASTLLLAIRDGVSGRSGYKIDLVTAQCGAERLAGDVFTSAIQLLRDLLYDDIPVTAAEEKGSIERSSGLPDWQAKNGSNWSSEVEIRCLVCIERLHQARYVYCMLHSNYMLLIISILVHSITRIEFSLWTRLLVAHSTTLHKHQLSLSHPTSDIESNIYYCIWHELNLLPATDHTGPTAVGDRNPKMAAQSPKIRMTLYDQAITEGLTDFPLNRLVNMYRDISIVLSCQSHYCILLSIVVVRCCCYSCIPLSISLRVYSAYEDTAR